MLQFYHRVTFTENIFIGRVPGKQFEEPDWLPVVCIAASAFQSTPWWCEETGRRHPASGGWSTPEIKLKNENGECKEEATLKWWYAKSSRGYFFDKNSQITISPSWLNVAFYTFDAKLKKGCWTWSSGLIGRHSNHYSTLVATTTAYLVFCQISSYYACFAPSCTAKLPFLRRKISFVAPLWGTWLRMHYWGIKREGKKPST